MFWSQNHYWASILTSRNWWDKRTLTVAENTSHFSPAKSLLTLLTSTRFIHPLKQLHPMWGLKMFLSSGDHLKTQKPQEVHNLNSGVPSNLSTPRWWWFPELHIKGMKFLLFQHSDSRKNMVAKGWFSPVESVAIFAPSRAGRLGKETLLRVPQLEGRVNFLCVLLHLPHKRPRGENTSEEVLCRYLRQAKQKRFVCCGSQGFLYGL